MAAFARAWRREIAFLVASPWDLGVVVVGPLLLLVVMGWLFLAGSPRHLPVALVDADHSTLSRQLARDLDASGAIRLAAEPADLPSAFALARQGKVWAVVYVPKNADRDALSGVGATIVVYDNASYYSLGALAARGVAEAIGGLSGQIAPRLQRIHNLPQARFTPPAVQATVLFNPGLSYEWFLEALIQPGVLHLMMSCAIVVTIGREFRDATFKTWIAAPREVAPALLGKLAPYVLVFTAWNLAGTAWLCGFRGWGVHGSLLLLTAGQFLMYAAYAALAAFVTVLIKDIPTALSAAAIYGGPAITFSDATLPTLTAPLFTRVLSNLLPFTSYVRLQMEQMFMGSPGADSLRWLTVLALFCAVLFPAACLLLRKPPKAAE
ncbi:ABC transporter permease [Caulobacter segnis]|uniref:ABC transporter permease n=1 Tax=Caulobacter segnis TaxID=88688 RepID=A0A2W5VMU0_9CAUL|nr:ABC transporter permease [Caulobacter segnis]PZR36665.1 MAG: ABC transporter permease [Caulobacter segnis]